MIDTDLITELSKDLGFDLCGFSSTKLSNNDKENIKEFINRAYYGTMDWFPKFQNIRLFYENLGFQPTSAISLGVLYNSPDYNQLDFHKEFKISRYAIGHDYHKVLRKLGKKMIDVLKKKFPDNKFRQSVDTLPISEKSIAKYAGLGWVGKNTNLISKEIGSYFFLTIILTDLELPANIPEADRCGKCRKCLDACPTNALFEPYKIDASRCISYLTIENKSEEINEEFKESLKGWIYGCDICQEVCPFNIKAEKRNYFTKLNEFHPLKIFKKNRAEIKNMSEGDFEALRKESAISRINYTQWKRNLRAIQKKPFN